MNEKQERIKKMVAEGKISQEEGQKLLDALKESKQKETQNTGLEPENMGAETISKKARWGLICSLIVPAPAVIWLYLFFSRHLIPQGSEHHTTSLWGILLAITLGLIPIVSEIMAFALSLEAISEINASHGKITGKTMAISGLVLACLWIMVPVIIILAVIIF